MICQCHESKLIVQEDESNDTIIGIWLYDAEMPDDIKTDMHRRLEAVFRHTHYFQDHGDFVQYVYQEVQKCRLCCVISGKNASCVLHIIAKCDNCCFKYGFQHQPQNTNSISNIYSYIETLFQKIRFDMKTYHMSQASPQTENRQTNPSLLATKSERSFPPFSIYEPRLNQNPIQHLRRGSLRFLLFQTMTDILIEMKHEDRTIDDMLELGRLFNLDNDVRLTDIDIFRDNYQSSQAIYHYTTGSFVNPLISRIFRSEDIWYVHQCQKYITDLHNELISKCMEQSDLQRPSVLYREKKVPLAVIQQLVDSRNSLISINGFVSTSSDRKVADTFSGQGQSIDGFGSVLFEIHLNSKIIRPFADISDVSQFEDEKEFLFSLGTVWRIQDIQLENDVWKVMLVPWDDLEKELKNLKSNLIYGQKLISVVDILRRLGEHSNAKRFCEILLKDDSLSKLEEGYVHNLLVMIYMEEKDEKNAAYHLQEALPLIQETSYENNNATEPRFMFITADRPSRMKICYNIGLMFQTQRNYKKALEYYNKGVQEKGCQSDKASIYYNSGVIHEKQANYKAARNCYSDALKFSNDHSIHQKSKRNLTAVEKCLNEHERSAKQSSAMK